MIFAQNVPQYSVGSWWPDLLVVQTDLSFDFVVLQRKLGVLVHWDQLYPKIVKPGITKKKKKKLHTQV